MSDPLLLGIDLGAGSLKATVITRAGRVAGVASRGVATLSPRPGFSEQDPEGWRQAMIGALADLWQAGVDARRIAAVSVSAGAHTHVLEDQAGRVLRPAIMWNDQRAGDQVARLLASDGAGILALSGNRVSATWTLPQLVWLCEHEPDVQRRIRRIRPAKDWLRRQLDESDVTDLTDAWGLMLADASGGGWSEALCGLAGIEINHLPDIAGANTLKKLCNCPYMITRINFPVWRQVVKRQTEKKKDLSEIKSLILRRSEKVSRFHRSAL